MVISAVASVTFGEAITRDRAPNILVIAVLTPLSSSTCASSARSCTSSKTPGVDRMPLTAWVTNRVPSRARIASVMARPWCTPTSVDASGTSLPML